MAGISGYAVLTGLQLVSGMAKQQYLYGDANRQATLDLNQRLAQVAAQQQAHSLAEMAYNKQERRFKAADAIDQNIIKKSARSQDATRRASFASRGGAFGYIGQTADLVRLDIYRDASELASYTSNNLRSRLDNLDQERINRRSRTFSYNSQVLAGAQAGGSQSALALNTANLFLETGLQLSGKDPKTGKVKLFNQIKS